METALAPLPLDVYESNHNNNNNNLFYWITRQFATLHNPQVA